MANIRNSISMTDRMTPTFRSILRAMDSTLRVMKNLDKQSNNGVLSKAYQRAEKDIQRANNQIIQMRNHALLAADGADQVSDAWNNVSKSVAKSRASLGSMLSSLAGGIYTIKTGLQGITKLTTTADSTISDVAKLSLFNTSESSDTQVYGQVYKTAQASRADLSGTAGLAQRIMLSDVYQGEGATSSAIDLAGTINKAMALGGGTSEENNRAILQLSQALSSGILQGDELRSLREQAPYLTKVLTEGLANVDDKFIGTTIGDLKELGAEGELTSDVVIKALQSMSDQIDETFQSSAPKTFSGAMTSMSNTVQLFISALSQADGPLGRLNQALWDFSSWLATPQGFEALTPLITVANLAVMAFQALGWAIQFVGSNFSWIAPIFGTILTLIAAYNAYLAISKAITTATSIAQGIGAVIAYAKAKADEKAALAAAAKGSSAAASAAVMMTEAAATASATAAQHGMNAALWACPLTWIIVAIVVLIGLIFLIVGIINKVTGSSVSAVGIIVGAITTAAAFIWNLFLGILDLVLGVFGAAWNYISQFVNFFANVFKDPIGSVIHLFGEFADTVLGVVETIASALDKVFGSDMAGTVADWRASLSATVEAAANKYGNGKYEQVMEHVSWTTEDLGMDRWAYGDAWDTGYDFGAGLENSFSGLGNDFNMDDYMQGLEPLEAEIAGGNLDSIGEIDEDVTVSDVDISDEDIRLLRDMAARDYLLQLQTITPVANVTFGDVKETADVNKILDVIEHMVEEQMATSLVS